MGDYRDIDCPKCGRGRVELDGVCDKCFWDADGGNFASITRPTEYDVQGYIFMRGAENITLEAELRRPQMLTDLFPNGLVTDGRTFIEDPDDFGITGLR